MIGPVKFAFKRAFTVVRWMMWGFFFIPLSVEGIKGVRSEIHPIQECFLPVSIEVKQETDGVFVYYTRAIGCKMIGTYLVKIVPPEGFPECDNTETIPYDPAFVNPEDRMRPRTVKISIHKFVGERCDLSPGTYKIKAVWTMKRDWVWDQTIELASKDFTIE